MCSTGKTRHADRESAIIALKRMSRVAEFSIYPCGKCHGWHIGKHPRKKKSAKPKDQ